MILHSLYGGKAGMSLKNVFLHPQIISKIKFMDYDTKGKVLKKATDWGGVVLLSQERCLVSIDGGVLQTVFTAVW